MPGTSTVGGAESVVPAGADAWSVTFHVPAPPPASESVTAADALCPVCTSPRDTELGDAKTSGLSARGEIDEAAAGPIGSREDVVPGVDPGVVAGLDRAALIWSTVQVG